MAKKREAAAGNLQILKNELKQKKLSKLYFFFGEETFLLNHYLEAVKKQILDPLTESFNYHRFSGENFDLTEFAEAVENYPMMAESTLVRVDDLDLFKMDESSRDKIIAVFDDIPDYCTILFTYLTISWKPDKRQKKLWDTIQETGLPVEFAKQDPNELIPWIGRRFSAKQKKISNELCSYLIDMTGGTMTALGGEIEKICAYSGAETIVKADIDAVVEPVLDAIVFQMTDRISEGNYEAALLSLEKLLKMQEEPLAILGAIGAHFRRLATAKVLLEKGKNAYDLKELCGIAEYPAKKITEAARYMEKSFCGNALEMIAETDYQMKSSFDDSVRLLELLILRISMGARHG